MQFEEAATIRQARYAKGQRLVIPNDGKDGFKGRIAYLCDFLKARWTNRERGYVMSVRKTQRLRYLYTGGYRAAPLADKLKNASSREVLDPTAKGASSKRWHDNAVNEFCEYLRRENHPKEPAND